MRLNLPLSSISASYTWISSVCASAREGPAKWTKAIHPKTKNRFLRKSFIVCDISPYLRFPLPVSLSGRVGTRDRCAKLHRGDESAAVSPLFPRGCLATATLSGEARQEYLSQHVAAISD